MKKSSIVVAMTLAISFLAAACNGPTDEEIRQTIEAEMAMNGTATAVAEQQASLEAQVTAIVNEWISLQAEKTAIAEEWIHLEEAKESISATQSAIAMPPPTEEAPATICPFYIYFDYGSDLNHFVPEGWMGDTADITFDDNYLLDAERQNVIQIIYTPSGSEQFAGIYWWDPPGSFFGSKDGGFDLSCAKKVTFWARGEFGGEKAEFKVGGIDGTYKDSLLQPESTGPITLTEKWVLYSIDLSEKDLSHTIGGFVWVTNKPSNPKGATIYLDEIRFEE